MNRIVNAKILSTIFVGFLILVGTAVPFAANATEDDGYYAGGYDGGYLSGGYDGGYYSGGYDGGYYSGGYDGFDGYYSGGYDGGYLSGGYDGGYDYGGCYDCYSYDYGCGYSCYDYFDYGCGFSCYSYSTPSFSIPGCSFCGGYSTPRYSVPSSSYSNVVTNTNTNVNNVTNIDNSIRDSFNTKDSYNTSLVVAAPQTPVVYTPPVQTYPAPYCVINNAQGSGYGSAYIAWSSANATSAYISGIGSVSLSGSQVVYPGYSTTYTMTVYGYNGQSVTCSTTVFANQAPYVALTQIPYTGFDFGPFGNAMYWAALASFAIAGAYLMVYYLPRLASGKAARGGMLALATAMVPARKKFAPIVAPKAPILVEKEITAVQADEVKVQPIIAAFKKAVGTIDTMAIIQSKDGSMPRIVIQRA